MPIYKYLIECLDEHVVKTYAFKAESFTVLRLHGGETYKLNSAKVMDYWRQWKQETGHTSEDSTDICIVWREGFDIEKFFSTGKAANVQTISPTTWNSEDIEKFFSFTARQLKSKLKIPLNSTIRVKTEGGQKFLVSTLAKTYPHKEKVSVPTPTLTPPKQEKLPVREKPSATSVDIATAWQELTRKHTTT